MADLDAARDREIALAVGRRIAGDHLADIGDAIGLAAIAAEIDAAQVVIDFVGTADEVAHHGDRAIGDQRHVGWDPHRPQVAGCAAGRGRDLRVACPAKSLESVELSDLDLVEAVVAAQ